MNWKEEYKKKVSTPAKAITDIHDGNCVVMGHAAAAPRIIQHALAEHCEDYNDVLIFHMTTLGENECLHPRCYGHFRHVSNFLSANSRDAVNHLEGDFFPAYFKDVPEMIGDEIPCDVAVFQAVAQQAFLRHPAVKQRFHLFYHAFLQTLTQAYAYAFDHHRSGKTDTNDGVLHVGHVGIGVGVAAMVLLYFERTEQAVTRFSVSVVVKFDVTSQAGCEFLVGIGLHAATEVGVDGCVGQLIALDHSLDIHARAPTKDGLATTRHNVVEGVDKVVLKLIDVILIACVVDVDEVVRDICVVYVIVGKVFARANIHATKHLARVGTNNLTAELVSQFGGETCLSTSRGACYGE